MKKALIRRFFKELDQELRKPAEIILTGAAAGSLLGVVRPSLDIDFEIRLKQRKRQASQLEAREIIQRIAEKVGVAVNYSENIGHWSMIHLLDYRKTALPCFRVGQLNIQVMAPPYWTIGKMARFLEVDIRDMVRMIRKKKLKPKELISLWGKALRSSPLSLELGSFSRNVTYFMGHYGKQVWGRKFNAEKGIALFNRSL